MAQSAVKTRIAWGAMAKVEATYQTDPVAVVGTDGLLLAAPPVCDHGTYLYDGHRGMTPAGVPLNRAARLGLEAKHTMTVEAAGANTAYSGSVYPMNVAFHALLVSCGLQGTFASSKWTYVPEVGPAGLDSVTISNYVEGQLYKLYGGYGDLTIEAKGPQIPLWTFVFVGSGDEPTDVAIPAISSYPTYATIPPEVANAQITIGAYASAIVKDFTFKLNRKVDSKRVNLNTAGNVHAGFSPLPPYPTLELTIEKQALKTATPWNDASNINPYQLRDNEVLIPLALQVGTTATNEYKIWAGATAASAQAQLVTVTETAEGPIGQWKLVFEYKPSTYGATDHVSIVFD